MESAISRASTLSTYYHLTGKADYVNKDLARYTGATNPGVPDTATKYLNVKADARVALVRGATAGGAQ